MNEKPVSKSAQGSPKMQQIERYGVIALVFLLVTIVAVSFWGDSKSPGFWSRLTGKGDAKKDTAEVAKTSTDPLVVNQINDPNVPITPTTTPPTPAPGTPLVTGNTPNVTDNPSLGTALVPPATPINPFVPGANLSTDMQTNPGVVPGTLPVATPPVTASGTVPYTIQSGDSLALIAKRQLGAESRWTEIQAANPGLDPKRLKRGATIQLPAGAAPVTASKPVVANASTKVAPKAKTASAPKTEVASAKSRSYTVKKGDLLRSIARAQLGDENRWKEIQAMNPGLDPTKLAVGQTIKLPSSGAKQSTPSSSKSSGETVLAAADKPRVK